ncbi:hypothetical protein BKA65DRAFT_48237 [Rhexocercosporidium sp. MPI-PUGE-AT-0058]|nr:hypothetical protein BKA65DRAFT_48237 [Rhexocercosporidium sp. MPI-PUGE-AT-0058]
MRIMQDLVCFQTRNAGTRWSAGDSIPFGPALSLSLITLGTCVARVGGCYLPKERRWPQLGICFTSTVLSLCLVGVVSSRVHSNQKFSNVYFGLLLPNCASCGLFEAELLWFCFTNVKPSTQWTILGAGIVLCPVVFGLTSWVLTMSDHFLLPTTVLLVIMCLFYVVLVTGYIKLLCELKTTKLSVRIPVQAGCACCILLFISTGTLLVISFVGLCSVDLGLWVSSKLFSTSCTLNKDRSCLLHQVLSLFDFQF